MTDMQHLIKKNFDRSAQQYLSNAELQRSPVLRMLNILDTHYDGSTILDLGSGCGTVAHYQLQHKYPIYAFDLSLNMLRLNQAQIKINGNAEYLPFADNSFSIIISNLMVQWAINKPQVLMEIKRILKPNGIVIMSSLVTPSLYELKQAYANIDNYSHTLDFLSQDMYMDLFAHQDLQVLHCETWQDTQYFTNLSTLLAHFKLTGTNLPKSVSNTGLGGRRSLQKLASAYQRKLQEHGFPLTYAYMLLVAAKE